MKKETDTDSIGLHRQFGSRYDDSTEHDTDSSDQVAEPSWEPADFNFQQLNTHPGPGGNPKASNTKGQFRFTRAHQWEMDDSPDKKKFGMECFGTTLMFILQSYGLVDADMTREQFEKTYTPIFGGATIKYDSDDVFTSRYKWYQKNEPSRLAGLSPQNAAINAVRGIKPRDIIKNADDLRFYLDAFAKMKAKEKGGVWNTAYQNFEFKTEDLSRQVKGKTLTGQMDTAKIDSHLAGGDTIYAGIFLDNYLRPAGNPVHESLAMGHRVLIKNKLADISVLNTHTNATETIAVYEADDAWYGSVGVFEHRLPQNGIVKTESGKQKAEDFVPAYQQKNRLTTIHTFSRDAFAASRIKKD